MALVAIDFGTWSSGWAVLETNNNNKLFNEKTGGKEDNPTVIMYQNDVPTAWGSRANDERNYDTEYDLSYNFFEGFKLKIAGLVWEENAVESDLEIKGSSGYKKLSVVVSDFLKLMKDSICERLNKGGIDTTTLKWSITIPAIWTDRMKLFMQRAATNASIHPCMFVYEPEAAAVYCSKVFDATQKISGSFMLVDCGGGTIDITCLGQDGTDMYQLCRSSGGLAGGTYVDKDFLKFLNENLETKIWIKDQALPLSDEDDERIKDYQKLEEAFRDKFKEYNADFTQFMSKWQLYKKRFNEDSKNSILSLPMAEIKLFTELKLNPAIFENRRGNLIITPQNMRTIFETSISQTIKYIEESFKEVKSYGQGNVEAILLVGGYANCGLLVKKVKERFDHEYKVMYPMGAVSAVVEGAAYYMNGFLIKNRYARFTYGIAVRTPYSPKYPSHLNVGGWVSNTFSKIVDIGQKIPVDWEKKQEYSVPENSSAIMVPLYQTTKNDGLFVSDIGMRKICTVTFPVLVSTELVPVFITLKFGGTMIEMDCEYNNSHHQGTFSL